MSDTYNLYNLEAPFKQFLLSGIAQSRTEPESTGSGTGTKKQLTQVSIKNYLSDIRHFFGWMIFKLKVKSEKLKVDQINNLDLVQNINSQLINEYKSYLSENNIPHKTVNRRLSTVRKFCSFCISQGWLKENPAKQVQNVKFKVQSDSSKLKNDEILDRFSEDLLNKKEVPLQVTNDVNNVKEFFQILNFEL